MIYTKHKLYLLSTFLLVVFSFSLVAQSNYSEAKRAYDEFRYDDAIYILEELTKKNNYRIEESLLLADSYIKTRNYQKGLALIDTLKRNNSRDFRVLEKELEIYLLENNNSKATDTISKIFALDSKNYYASYAEGLLKERAGYFASAESLYEKARLINPKRSEATVGIAYLKLMSGKKAEALKFFNENVNNNSRDYLAYYNLANFSYINGNYNQALQEINNSFYYNPNSLETKKLQVNVYSVLKRYDEAIAVLQSIPENMFDGVNKDYYIGEVYEEAKNYNKAKEYYINNLRENSYDELGRFAYERVLLLTNPKIDTQREKAANYYTSQAEYYGKLADPVRSFVYYKRMLKLNPENIYARVSLSDAYKTLGYLEKSLEQLSVVARMYPNEKSYSYKYDNDQKIVNRLIPSKAWGINQYNIRAPGYSVAIGNIVALKETPRTLSLAISENISLTLNQITKFRTYDYYTNNLNSEYLYNRMAGDKIDFYIQGSSFLENDSLTLYLELIYTPTRQSITNFSLLVKGRDKMMNASVIVAKTIAGNIPFYSKVSKVENNDIYINAGRWHGITNDMSILVYYAQNADYSVSKKDTNLEEKDAIGIMKVITADENVSLCRLVDSRAMRYVRVGNVAVIKK